ncbi:MAG: Lrp/AsnC family transcriptional regulator [Eubacteriales bacterium]|nr:Lrp/AsnC family transcriptional regulator [Eubacteriales bacterium]
MQLDEIDLQIIQLLRQDGRMTHEAISKQLGLTRPAIHKRVQKLTDSGTIQRYKAEIDWEKLGFPLYAMINLWVNASDFQALFAEIKTMCTPSLYIESSERITGQYSIVLRVRAKSTLDLTILHDKLLATNEIKETLTSMILQRETPEIPLTLSGDSAELASEKI